MKVDRGYILLGGEVFEIDNGVRYHRSTADRNNNILRRVREKDFINDHEYELRCTPASIMSTACCTRTSIDGGSDAKLNFRWQ